MCGPAEGFSSQPLGGVFFARSLLTAADMGMMLGPVIFACWAAKKTTQAQGTGRIATKLDGKAKDQDRLALGNLPSVYRHMQGERRPARPVGMQVEGAGRSCASVTADPFYSQAVP